MAHAQHRSAHPGSHSVTTHDGMFQLTGAATARAHQQDSYKPVQPVHDDMFEQARNLANSAHHDMLARKNQTLEHTQKHQAIKEYQTEIARMQRGLQETKAQHDQDLSRMKNAQSELLRKQSGEHEVMIKQLTKHYEDAFSRQVNEHSSQVNGLQAEIQALRKQLEAVSTVLQRQLAISQDDRKMLQSANINTDGVPVHE
jgi:DNA anti-recombination protein RmuC